MNARVFSRAAPAKHNGVVDRLVITIRISPHELLVPEQHSACFLLRQPNGGSIDLHRRAFVASRERDYAHAIAVRWRRAISRAAGARGRRWRHDGLAEGGEAAGEGCDGVADVLLQPALAVAVFVAAVGGRSHLGPIDRLCGCDGVGVTVAVRSDMGIVWWR